MVPDETSDLPTTLPEASFLNPNWKVPSEARSLRGLFPVPVFAEFPSYSLSKNADGFLQNPFWLSYCNLRKLKSFSSAVYARQIISTIPRKKQALESGAQFLFPTPKTASSGNPSATNIFSPESVLFLVHPAESAPRWHLRPL